MTDRLWHMTSSGPPEQCFFAELGVEKRQQEPFHGWLSPLDVTQRIKSCILGPQGLLTWSTEYPPLRGQVKNGRNMVPAAKLRVKLLGSGSYSPQGDMGFSDCCHGHTGPVWLTLFRRIKPESMTFI